MTLSQIVSLRNVLCLVRAGAYRLVHARRDDGASFLTVMVKAACWFGSVCARGLRYVRSRQEHNAIAVTAGASSQRADRAGGHNEPASAISAMCPRRGDPPSV